MSDVHRFGLCAALVVVSMGASALSDVEFHAPNKSQLTGDVTAGAGELRVVLDLARGTTLKVKAKGSKSKGAATPAVTFDVLDAVGSVLVSGTPKGTGARLKRYSTTESGMHALEFSAAAAGTGRFVTKVVWKSPKGVRETVALTSAISSVPFSAEASSQAVVSLTRTKGSAATPQLVEIRSADDSFVHEFPGPASSVAVGAKSAKGANGAKAGPVTLPQTGDYLLVVRSTGADGDASARVKLRAPRARSFKASATDADVGASEAGVVTTLQGAAVLPGGAPLTLPNGASVLLPEGVGGRAQPLFIGVAAEFDPGDVALSPLGGFVFCGPSGASFSAPARVRLPVAPGIPGVNAGDIVVARRAADGAVSVLPSSDSTIDVPGGAITVEATTFSSFAAFAPLAPAAPKFFSSDIAASDQFGTRIATDGDTAIIAALSKSPGGAAYVFERTGDRWTQRQRLQAPDTDLVDAYGSGADIDGDTLVVGSARHDEAGVSAGSAYVWVRGGATWALEQELLPRDVDTSPNFGVDVAVSGDTVVVGAFKDDELGFDAGAAYVFTRTAGVWTLQQKLTASDGFTGHGFGFGVDIDGDTVVVGATGDPATGARVTAAAYVFTRTTGVWTERAILQGTEQTRQTGMGQSVRIENGTIVAGAATADDVGTNAGAVWVFTGSGAIWAQQAQLTPSDSLEFGYFGRRVDLDGDRIVVGAWASGTGRAGAVYVYERAGGVWAETEILTSFDGFARQLFGADVAIAGDAVLVGGAQDTEKGANAGAVYTFELE